MGRYLAFTSYFGKVGKDKAEVFGEEFSALSLTKTIKDTLEVLMSMDKSIIVASVAHDDVIGIGNQTCVLRFFVDAISQIRNAFTSLSAD